ncbi:MAG: copper resistance CopC family protein [Actinomadura sp.]
MIAGAIAAAALVITSAMPAAAHTALRASSPKDGGKIDVAPSELLLEFSEPIRKSGFRLVVQGPDDSEYQAGAPRISGDTLTQPLKQLGPTGEYRVEFRIVSADGHPLTGGIRFTLTKPGPAAGGIKAVPPAPLVSVSASSLSNAPSWAWSIGAAAVVILTSGAVLFGRRVTRGLD